MDQQLKQRIIGAIVMTCLAVIFIPMLFDDPIDDSAKRVNQYTIPAVPQHLAQDNSSIPKSSKDITSSFKKTTPSAPSAKKIVRWYIQTGLFSQQKNADILHTTLIKQGFDSKITRQSKDDKITYKVIVGPELTKPRALATKSRIDKLNQLNSFVFEE